MAPPGRSYGETGEFLGAGWRSGPVRRASTFAERWRGLSFRPVTVGLWLPGSSIHGLGMVEPIWVCGLDGDRAVRGIKKLIPGRFLRLRGATSVLELPISCPPPPQGMALTWLDAGDTHSLRHSDRQPR